MLTIMSGGQTGVDRAALDVALELGLPCGGWCPKGRLAEDGIIPERYPLKETKSAAYPERTRKNIEDSCGTLILTRGMPQGGTALTIRIAEELLRRHLVIDLDTSPAWLDVHDWIWEHVVFVLNVAGPRESEQPGIHKQAADFLLPIFTFFAELNPKR